MDAGEVTPTRRTTVALIITGIITGALLVGYANGGNTRAEADDDPPTTPGVCAEEFADPGATVRQGAWHIADRIQ